MDKKPSDQIIPLDGQGSELPDPAFFTKLKMKFGISLY